MTNVVYLENSPKKVWLKDEDVSGLVISRNFGDDIAHTYRVICEPGIMEI